MKYLLCAMCALMLAGCPDGTNDEQGQEWSKQAAQKIVVHEVTHKDTVYVLAVIDSYSDSMILLDKHPEATK